MSEHCNIRAFAPGDLPALNEIRQAAFKPVFQSFRTIVGKEIAAVALANAEKEQGEFFEKMCAPDSSHTIFVAEIGGRIVGFCSVSFDDDLKVGEIDLAAVHPDHDGKGVGAMMFEHGLELMREAGMKAAAVGTGGDPSHAPARRAYEKVGFTVEIPGVHLYRML